MLLIMLQKRLEIIEWTIVRHPRQIRDAFIENLIVHRTSLLKNLAFSKRYSENLNRFSRLDSPPMAIDRSYERKKKRRNYVKVQL